ncbi:HARBI1 [Mytilus edulis]|uniref:Putative nuclease HARBI1 n=1 Tax=Mytilus edulis TaxID=6550 RepID=A0A8S3UKW7_MYTED|nr:HARBI1 [Mytilus edulis]
MNLDSDYTKTMHMASHTDWVCRVTFVNAIPISGSCELPQANVIGCIPLPSNGDCHCDSRLCTGIIGLHKGTVSRIVSDVLTSLCNKRNQFIKWPRNVEETRGDFYRLSGFPNVLGAIDGTHVRIQAPSEDEASFVNRKGVHSVNVQAVCDAKGKFTNINANWPGSSHDSHIFRTSQVCTYMEENGGWANGVLLGDSGYPCRPFLMTPYQNPVLDHQKSTTNATVQPEIRMKPGKACKIIIACAILHNICILLNEPDIEDDGVIVGNDGDLGEHFNGHQDGRAVRDHISTTFFNH